jgi:starch-binding outer membrane protein, SusD/RagB family
MFRKITLSLLVIAGLAWACNDVLDITPADRIDLENFYSSPADAESALIGCYTQTLRADVYTNYLFTNNRSSGDLTAPIEGPNVDAMMSRQNLNAGDGDVGNLWRTSYQSLAAINLLIERLPGIDDALFRPAPGVVFEGNRKNQIMGEARFLRAFIYYHMWLNWGGVPLITSFPTSSNPQANQVARNTSDEVKLQILADLDYAEANLPWNHEDLAALEVDQIIQSKGRATAGAAKMLKARIAMIERRWQDAITLSKEVINQGEFRLAQRWVTIFDPTFASQNSSESVMEIQTVQGAAEFNNTGAYSWFTQDGSPRRGATLEAYNLFEGTANDRRDVRKVFSMTQRTDIPEQIYAIKYRNAYPWWNPEDPFNFVPFRLTESYLVVAEALNELSYPNEEALNYINLIRDRAKDLDYPGGGASGIAPYSFSAYDTQEKFRAAIREERRRELMFEGHTYFDLLRYDSYDGGNRAQQATRLTAPDRTLWPIPDSEIRLNPKLVQNPGYN